MTSCLMDKITVDISDHFLPFNAMKVPVKRYRFFADGKLLAAILSKNMADAHTFKFRTTFDVIIEKEELAELSVEDASLAEELAAKMSEVLFA